MTFDAQDLSRFEFCTRYPQLYRAIEPPRWPVREAVKRFLESGIRALMRGESPDETCQRFVLSAANPGYLYPDGDPYNLAQDHNSWLDGALRLILDEFPQMEQLPVFEIDSHHLHIEAWRDSAGDSHIFRASSNLGNRTVRWPELAASALTGQDVHIHVYRLPSARSGRLLSPLVTAYQHPSFAHINYRLARLYDEPEFNKNWKKIGRWEIQPNPSWEEWKIGIDRDNCIDQIREVYTLSPMLDDYAHKQVLFDLEHMLEVMEAPTIWPRYREKCQGCVMNGFCHGDEDSRAGYSIALPEELTRFENLLKKKITG